MSLYTERDGAGERTYAPTELASELSRDEMLTLAGFVVDHVATELREREGPPNDEMDQLVARLDDVVDTLGQDAQALRDERAFADEDLDLAAVCEGSDDEGNILYIIDCQVCGVIVDTLNEADYEDASARADDLRDAHNATHRGADVTVMHASDGQGGRTYVVHCSVHGHIEAVHYPSHPLASLRASDLAKSHNTAYHDKESP